LSCFEENKHAVCSTQCKSEFEKKIEFECHCNKVIPPFGIVMYSKDHCNWKKNEQASCANSTLLNTEQMLLDVSLDNVDQGEDEYQSGDPSGDHSNESNDGDNYATEFEYETYRPYPHNTEILDDFVKSEYTEYEESEEKLNFEPAQTDSLERKNAEFDTTRHPRTCPKLNEEWNCSHGNLLRSLCTKTCTANGSLSMKKCICITRNGKFDCGWKIKGRECPSDPLM